MTLFTVTRHLLFALWLEFMPHVVLAQKKVETHHPNGKIKEVFSELKDKRSSVKHGDYFGYHQNGQLVQKGKYDHGVKVGLWWEYFSNGKVKEIFNFDSQSAVPYTLDLLLYNGLNLVGYPKEAVIKKLEGDVEIRFEVDSLCRCRNLDVVASSDPIFDDEARSAGQLLMKNIEREQILRCDNRIVTLPVKFRLQ